MVLCRLVLVCFIPYMPVVRLKVVAFGPRFETSVALRNCAARNRARLTQIDLSEPSCASLCVSKVRGVSAMESIPRLLSAELGRELPSAPCHSQSQRAGEGFSHTQCTSSEISVSERR